MYRGKALSKVRGKLRMDHLSKHTKLLLTIRCTHKRILQPTSREHSHRDAFEAGMKATRHRWLITDMREMNAYASKRGVVDFNDGPAP